jgi:hypothetical protein
MFRESPGCAAYARKDHYNDLHVRIGHSGADVSAACRSLVSEVEAVECVEVAEGVSAGDSSRTSSRDSCAGSAAVGLIRLRSSSASLASLVRKALMTRVLVLAAVEVEIEENSGSLLDEIVASRLGLVAFRAPEGLDAALVRGFLDSDDVHVLAGAITFNEPAVSVAPSYARTILSTMPSGGRLRLSFRLDWGTSGGAGAHDRHSAVVCPSHRPHVLIADGEAGLLSLLSHKGYVFEADTQRSSDGSGWIRALELAAASGGPGLVPGPVRFEAIEEIAGAYCIGTKRSAAQMVRLSDTDFDIEFETQGQYTPKRCLELALAAVVAEATELLARAPICGEQAARGHQ